MLPFAALPAQVQRVSLTALRQTPSEAGKLLESQNKGKPECLYNPLSGVEVLVILRARTYINAAKGQGDE